MQILLNFLSNAIKFTDVGKQIIIRVVVLEIQNVSLQIQPNSLGLDQINSNSQNYNDKYCKLRIEIEDQGKGISEENIGNLFIDFGKLDEHSSINLQGTGLGLSICKRIVEQMGGQVSVKSKINVGSIFSITVSTKMKDQIKSVNNIKKYCNSQ